MPLRALPMLCLLLCAATAGARPELQHYDGLCDASAAVALDAQHFVVAGDEDNRLRIYARGRQQPLATLPLDGFLQTGDEEADLEAATRIGERIYWIASLSRDGRGRLAPGRDRFFATDIDRSTVPPTLRPVGTAPARLRNPLRAGRALVLTLDNPAEVLDGQPPRWGSAHALALGGRGVRAMTRVADGYLLAAGPVADAGSFALFHWRGGDAAPQQLPEPALGTLRPEALFSWPDGPLRQLASDDGGMRREGRECKKLPAKAQAFRSLLFER